MTCSCGVPAQHEIRGTRLCSEHYIEALEHSAHILSWVNDGNRPQAVLPEPSVEAMKNYLDKPPIY
jgi:hypothetical protein